MRVFRAFPQYSKGRVKGLKGAVTFMLIGLKVYFLGSKRTITLMPCLFLSACGPYLRIREVKGKNSRTSV